MKKITTLFLMLLFSAGVIFAQRITENVNPNLWTFGSIVPELATGIRGDTTTGAYHHLLVGTSPYYYQVQDVGIGSVTFWIYDPYKCQDSVDPGYGTDGPGWGLMDPASRAITVGIHRESYLDGCLGYKAWSSVEPNTPYWFKYGLRGADPTIPFTAGWYKWTVNGTYNDITFTMYNVTWTEVDGHGCGCGNPLPTSGNCAVVYTAATGDCEWAPAFGNGWQALWFKGDVPVTGIEDISVDVVSGTGVFAGFNPTGVARPYHNTTWGNIKALYK